MIEAYYAYARWGAKAKVEDLEKRYPQLLVPYLISRKYQPQFQQRRDDCSDYKWNGDSHEYKCFRHSRYVVGD